MSTGKNPQAHAGMGRCCGMERQGHGAHPWPMQAPTSALQCYSGAMRDQKEEEERDRSKRGRKGQKITGFGDERGA